MSAENVEIVREIYRRYVLDPASTFELLDPEIEWSEPPEVPDSQTSRGHEGVRRSLRKFVGTWENFHLEVVDLIDAGDSVIACTRLTGRGKGSGVEIDQDQFAVWTLRNGKAVRLQMVFDGDEADRVAGLSDDKTAAGGKP